MTVTSDTLTKRHIEALRASLCDEPCNQYTRDIILDIDRMRDEVRGRMPPWYAAAARARIAAAINARSES